MKTSDGDLEGDVEMPYQHCHAQALRRPATKELHEYLPFAHANGQGSLFPIKIVYTNFSKYLCNKSAEFHQNQRRLALGKAVHK